MALFLVKKSFILLYSYNFMQHCGYWIELLQTYEWSVIWYKNNLQYTVYEEITYVTTSIYLDLVNSIEMKYFWGDCSILRLFAEML